MKQRQPAIVLVTLLCVAACHKPSNPEPTPQAPAPAKAVLTSPVQNETCTSGAVVSATQSTIVFKWNPSQNTDSYELHVKDLEAKTESTQVGTTGELSVTLSRGKAYAWYVVSKSTKTTQAAQSDTWKFYCAAPGVVSYAPFPPELTSPQQGATVRAVEGKITLLWSGSDVDGDLKDYDVYLGTSPTPALLKAGVSSTTLADVVVGSGNTYYWKVVARDSKGNTSESATSQFQVN